MMEKKIYQSPATTVIRMAEESSLLAGSTQVKVDETKTIEGGYVDSKNNAVLPDLWSATDEDDDE